MTRNTHFDANKILNFFGKISTSGFWFWNIVLLFFVGFGFLPFMGLDIFQDAARMPWDFTFFSMVLLLIAPVSVWYGWKKCQSPTDYLVFFYGVEMPLFYLALARFFMLRQMTGGTTFLAVMIILAIGGCLFARRAQSKPHFKWSALISTSAGLWNALYFALITSFFILPTAWGAIEVAGELLTRLTWASLTEITFFMIYGGLLLVTGTILFLMLPFFLLVSYIANFRTAFLAFPKKFGIPATTVLIILFSLIWHFSSSPPKWPTELESKQGSELVSYILENEVSLKDKLVDQYLAPYRYLAEDNDQGLIVQMYAGNMNFSDEFAIQLQRGFNYLIKPLLYPGPSMLQDQTAAEKLYEEWFDVPIQIDQRKEIFAALNATYNRDEREASILATEARDIWLARQEISVQQAGQFVDIELHEVYENMTLEDKEVVYYFQIPQGSVFTGVWLNQDGDDPKMFSHVVSPRGAAQQVYRTEVNRGIDPAILEQVGIDTFRLKVFPVEGRMGRERRARKTHLWLSYSAIAQPSGEIALPKLLEKRNIYWDKDTKRSINGSTIVEEKSWLPKLPRMSAPKGFAVKLSNGQYASYIPKRKMSHTGKNIAVVVDKTYSMRQHREQTSLILKKLGAFSRNTGNRITIVAANKKGIHPWRAADPDYGDGSRAELVRNFAKSTSDRFDAVVLVSDSSADEEDAISLASYEHGPLWILFVDEKPATYLGDDLMGKILYTGGGVATDTAALTHSLAAKSKWVLTRSLPRAPIVDSDGAKAHAATFLLKELAKGRDHDSSKFLLGVHQVALTNDIVSPWSTMIVLVNDQQRELLAKLSQADDAFQRENETGQTLLDGPTNKFNVVPATPEPEEWALFIVLLGILLYYYRERIPTQLLVRIR